MRASSCCLISLILLIASSDCGVSMDYSMNDGFQS
jgi:hypothetical protein